MMIVQMTYTCTTTYAYTLPSIYTTSSASTMSSAGVVAVIVNCIAKRSEANPWYPHERHVDHASQSRGPGASMGAGAPIEGEDGEEA